MFWKWFNAQEQKWHCKDFPFSLIFSFSHTNHLEDEFSLYFSFTQKEGNSLLSLCSKFPWMLKEIVVFHAVSEWEQKLEVFSFFWWKSSAFCYLCAAAVAASQLHYNNPMSKHDFYRAKRKREKCWNFYFFSLFFLYFASSRAWW